jgi:3-deoxy-7-phosphoheptulonate synthase
MVESNLLAGTQKLVKGKALTYGQSITDACIGWDETVKLLREMAEAVRRRTLSAT